MQEAFQGVTEGHRGIQRHFRRFQGSMVQVNFWGVPRAFQWVSRYFNRIRVGEEVVSDTFQVFSKAYIRVSGGLRGVPRGL